MRTTIAMFLGVLLAGLVGRPAHAWFQSLDGGSNGLDEALGVAVDAAGDAVAAGYTTGTNGTDLAVVKRAANDGALRWPSPVIIDGSAHGADRANAVVVDATGDVVVAGYLTNTGTGRDFTVVKLAGADGQERWRRTFTGTATNSNDEAMAIAVDAAGDVVAVGFTHNTTTIFDILVVKLSGTDGTPRWSQPVVVNGSANGGDFGNAVAIDGNGDVLAAGLTDNTTTGLDFTVLKLSGTDGQTRWMETRDGTGPDDDEAHAIVADAAGDVLVAGTTGNAGQGWDFTVMKLSGTDGHLLWPAPVIIHGSGEADEDEAFAIAADPSGNAIATGVVVTGTVDGDSFGFTVVKLAAADGAERWRATVAGSAVAGTNAKGHAVAVDGLGNAIAAGRIDNADAGDFVLVELAAADGHEFWRAVEDGDALTDVARAVAVDRFGNAVGAGRITSATTGGDLAMVKLGCGGGDPVVCPGGDACHVGSVCDPATVACVAVAKPDGTSCSDGNGCTVNDACQGGSCAGTLLVCDGEPCRPSSCDPATGMCVSSPAADGTPCNDGVACTSSETCLAGTCEPDDLEAATCAVDGGLAAPTCSGQKIPRGVKRAFKRAGTLLRKVESVTDATKRNKLLDRIGKFLDKARRGVDKAANRAKKPLSAACATALRDAIAEGQLRIARLRA